MVKLRQTWILWFTLLAIPGSGFLRFDGLPFSSKIEFALIAISSCILFSSEIRKRFRIALSSNHGQTKRWINTILFAAIILKFLTFVMAPLGDGFESCYRSIYAPVKQEVRCEKSFEAPFLESDRVLNTDQITRMEPILKFGPSGDWINGGASNTTWRLPFVNEYPRFETKWLDRLPFTAKFGSFIEAKRDGYVPVQFVGEVSVSINGNIISAGSYSQPAIILVPVPKGTSKFILDFKFADRDVTEIPDQPPQIRGPWAQLFVGKPMSMKSAMSDLMLNLRGWSVVQSKALAPNNFEVRNERGDVLASAKPLKREDVAILFKSKKLEYSGFDFSVRGIDSRNPNMKVELVAIYPDGSEVSLGKLGYPVQNPLDISTVEISQQAKSADTAFDAVWFSIDTQKKSPLKPTTLRFSRKVSLLFAMVDVLVMLGTFLILAISIVALKQKLIAAIRLSILVLLGKWILDFLPFDWWGFRSTVIPVLVAMLVGHSLRRNNPPDLIGVIPVALAAIFGPTLYLARSFMGLGNAPWWGFEFFRGRDSDWFVAQGYARRIFVDTSLNAGENLFYFQPATRYLVFIQHLLFGENDVLLGILMAVGLLTAAVFAARETLKYLVTKHEQLLITLFIVACFVIFTEQIFLTFALAPSSEYTTWILIFVTFGVILQRSISQPVAIIATIMAALTAQFRPNQASGALFLFLLIQSELGTGENLKRILDRFQLLIVFAVTSSLSLIHNIYYGGQFLIFSNTGPLVSDFSYLSLLHIFSDDGARAIFLSKLGMYFNYGLSQTPLSVSFWIFDILWLLAVAQTIWLKNCKFRTWIVLTFPLAYLVPQIPYEIRSYYPRHIVAAHLAFGLSGLYVLSRQSQKYSELSGGNYGESSVGHIGADSVDLPVN